MNKEVLSFIVEKIHEPVNTTSCSKEAKASVQTWLDAVGTENGATVTKTYVAESEADVMPADGPIGFIKSDMCTQIFGVDKARDVITHTMELKAAGAKYCDCPACAATEAVLKGKDGIPK